MVSNIFATMSRNPLSGAFDGDDRYRWLNRVQAVAKGVLNGLTLTYEVCEVR